MIKFLKVIFVLVLSSNSESFFNNFQPRKKNYSINSGISNFHKSDFNDHEYQYASEYYNYLIKYDKIEHKILPLKISNSNSNSAIEIAKSREKNYRIFEKNFIKINKINKKNTLNLKINKFTDQIDFDEEQSDLMTKTVDKNKIIDYDLRALKQVLQNPIYYSNKFQNISTSISWNPYLSPVKDQGSCGSCWAFSTTGALEGVMRFNNYSVERLSEQELVDCSTENYGCGGGLMHLAFDYIISNKGISSNLKYPYTARDGDCRCLDFSEKNCNSESCDCDNESCDCNSNENLVNEQVIGSNITDYWFTIPRSISDIMASLKYSPISIALDASKFEFRFYGSGVIDIPSNESNTINHAVLLTGYDFDEEGPYWIIQNSWGKDWGDNGYAKIRIRNGDGVLLSQLYGVYPKY